jgi:hypothetical protein
MFDLDMKPLLIGEKKRERERESFATMNWLAFHVLDKGEGTVG